MSIIQHYIACIIEFMKHFYRTSCILTLASGIIGHQTKMRKIVSKNISFCRSSTISVRLEVQHDKLDSVSAQPSRIKKLVPNRDSSTHAGGKFTWLAGGELWSCVLLLYFSEGCSVWRTEERT